ncbi:hypothetical protein PF008_g26441 [Phytophthora fragariae]|uniref:Reverse transcriptase Ty1/copia-type domain-containing protein n=1 Tax=Phytophthora fragariae TaxID=53985 RepID=A0A6G0QHY5_9STRA|nr:hypothetical protein PF008_g26441 [Phytophthora fragariae]
MSPRSTETPNAYVIAQKEAELDIFLRLPRGMVIPEDVRKRLGVTKNSELVLVLTKALYGLKQAGRLWNQLFHKSLIKLEFAPSLTDMCVYHSHRGRPGGCWCVGRRPAGHGNAAASHRRVLRRADRALH